MPLGKGLGAHLQRKENFRLCKNLETVNSVRSALFAKFMKRPDDYSPLSITRGVKIIQVPKYLVSGNFGDIPVDRSSASLISSVAHSAFTLSNDKSRVDYPIHLTILGSRTIEYLSNLTILLSSEVEILFESFKFQIWCRLHPPSSTDSLQICSLRQVFKWNLPLLSSILSCIGIVTIDNIRYHPYVCTECRDYEPFHSYGQCNNCSDEYNGDRGDYESCDVHGHVCRYLDPDLSQDRNNDTLLVPSWSYLPILAHRYIQLIDRLLLEGMVTSVDLNLCTGSCAQMLECHGRNTDYDYFGHIGQFPMDFVHVARFMSVTYPDCKRMQSKLFIRDELRYGKRSDSDAFLASMYFTGT